MQDLTGTVFREYHLIRCLGRGASSSVYLGEHVDLKILVAIKILHTYLSEKDSERFRNEAQLITRLDHPNIVAAHAYDIEDGVPFIVMNYAPQGSLRQRYPKGVRLANEDIVRYVTQVASALQYIHDRARLIHRDVKPENMLLGPDDQVWLSDFGVSLMMPSPDDLPVQKIAGSIRYLAPEQIRGKPCLASDQYALGIVVYEWLSGSPPFTGLSGEIPVQHIHLPPPSLHEKVPTIAPAVDEVVLRALAKAPQARFPSVRAFADALKEAFEQISRPVLDLPLLPVISVSAPSVWQPTLSSQDEPMLQLPAPSIVIQPMTKAISPPPASFAHRADTPFVHTPPLSTTPLSLPPPVRVKRLSRRSVIIGLASIFVTGGGTIAFGRLHASIFPLPPARTSSDGARSGGQTLFTSVPQKQNTPVLTPGSTLYTYRGHTQAAKSVAWVSNQRVASGSLDGTVRIWDAMTGGNVLIYRGHQAGVKSIAVSPDGTSIASGDGGGEVHIWDATTGRDRLAPFAGDRTHAVRGITWSPDRYAIASGSDDSTVSIWEMQAGRRLFTYSGHRGPLRGVAWSPNGQFLASCSVDKTVQIWSATDRKQQALFIYRGHSDVVWCVAWSPDGTLIASASQDGTVQVWNSMTGALVARHVVPAGKAESVIWSPGGQFIAGGSDDGTTQTWSVITDQLVLRYHQQKGTIWSLAWSPDGMRIASSSSDNTIKVWQAG